MSRCHGVLVRCPILSLSTVPGLQDIYTDGARHVHFIIN